jgi:predicted MFS family arabinose efflux permease
LTGDAKKLESKSSSRNEVSQNPSSVSTKKIAVSLVISQLLTAIPVLITSLLLIEISQSFSVAVGVAGQVRTVASAASVVMGLVMSGLSIKFDQKSLLLAGVGLTCVSAISCAITPTFGLLFGAFAVFGIGRAMIRPTNHALVGRLFTVSERPKFTSYSITGIASAYLIGSAITAVVRDWRLVFVLFIMPTALVSLVLVISSIPKSSKKTSGQPSNFLQAYRMVLSNKSALACLIGNVCAIITQNVVLVSYVSTFLRQTYLIDITFVSIVFSVMALITIIGTLIGGRLVHRVGRKRITVITVFFISVCAIGFMNLPSLWASLLCTAVGGFLMGIKNTAHNSLALEQIPEYRGTMMSLSEVSRYVAQMVGNGLGGLILILTNYQLLGLTLGCFAIAASGIYQFFTLDPTRLTTDS